METLSIHERLAELLPIWHEGGEIASNIAFREINELLDCLTGLRLLDEAGVVIEEFENGTA